MKGNQQSQIKTVKWVVSKKECSASGKSKIKRKESSEIGMSENTLGYLIYLIFLKKGLLQKY